MTIRVMLVDDHEVVRLGLRSLLAGESDVRVVAEAGTVAEAIRVAEVERPDVALLDIRLPDGSGIDACRSIRIRSPSTQVIMLTSFAEPSLVLEAIEAGAVGYVLKQLDTSDLLKAVRAVASGDSVLDPAVTREVLALVKTAAADAQSRVFRDLTDREVEVLALVAEGRTNAEIGADLSLSEKTVRNHVSTILSKLGLTNRIEAATLAVRHGLEVRPRGDGGRP
jgi:DNA-binding NarL/FixJ family response regulator